MILPIQAVFLNSILASILSKFQQKKKSGFRNTSNMVNHYPRKEFGFNSPYQLAEHLLPKKVLALNKLHFIQPDKVKLILLRK